VEVGTARGTNLYLTSWPWTPSSSPLRAFLRAGDTVVVDVAVYVVVMTDVDVLVMVVVDDPKLGFVITNVLLAVTLMIDVVEIVAYVTIVNLCCCC
jgi:hypothetical protein